MKNKTVSYVHELRISLIRFRAVLKVPSALAVFAVLLVSVATETLTDLVDSLGERLLLMAALSILVIFYFKKWEIPFRKEEASFGQIDNAKLHHRKGLVILIGLSSDKPDSPVAKLLKQAKSTETIALLGTPEVTRLGVFDRIVEQLLPAAGLDIKPEKLRIWNQGNAQSIGDSHRETYEALTWMLSKGYGPQEIVVDISEGRRAMHIGADRAATSLSVEVQYLGPQWNHIENKPVEGSEAFKVVSEEY